MPPLVYAAGARIKDLNEHRTRISREYPHDWYLDDGHASATIDFGVRNGILEEICACALGSCIYDVKLTREYRMNIGLATRLLF